jgi:hypothetical protein
MLEIILIVYLAKRIGKIAEEKRHARAGYQALFVLLWIVFEFLGVFIGIFLLGDEIMTAYFFALLGAGLACLISFSIVNSLSEKGVQIDDEIKSQEKMFRDKCERDKILAPND